MKYIDIQTKSHGVDYITGDNRKKIVTGEFLSFHVTKSESGEITFSTELFPSVAHGDQQTYTVEGFDQFIKIAYQYPRINNAYNEILHNESKYNNPNFRSILKMDNQSYYDNFLSLIYFLDRIQFLYAPIEKSYNSVESYDSYKYGDFSGNYAYFFSNAYHRRIHDIPNIKGIDQLQYVGRLGEITVSIKEKIKLDDSILDTEKHIKSKDIIYVSPRLYKNDDMNSNCYNGWKKIVKSNPLLKDWKFGDRYGENW